jgi:hypothetical protein
MHNSFSMSFHPLSSWWVNQMRTNWFLKINWLLPYSISDLWHALDELTFSALLAEHNSSQNSNWWFSTSFYRLLRFWGNQMRTYMFFDIHILDCLSSHDLNCWIRKTDFWPCLNFNNFVLDEFLFIWQVQYIKVMAFYVSARSCYWFIVLCPERKVVQGKFDFSLKKLSFSTCVNGIHMCVHVWWLHPVDLYKSFQTSYW